MAAPSITVVNASTNTTQTNWSVGVVKANNDSSVLQILIWNNKGGSNALSDLRDVTITSLDTDGGAASDPVANKWLKVNAPEMQEVASAWTAVGGTTTKMIRADGLASTDGNVIKGTANDGNASTAASKANYATINLKVSVPISATPNTYNFKTRINGYYVG